MLQLSTKTYRVDLEIGWTLADLNSVTVTGAASTTVLDRIGIPLHQKGAINHGSCLRNTKRMQLLLHAVTAVSGSAK